ncbi:hypothetical protein ABEX18_05490, partial [Aneurinibacillus migulanus]|uniref:hypothetical protein n=1 Tax=Aneurinibacillus migulanus TaxID=47500 RepID=UPI003D1CCC0E
LFSAGAQGVSTLFFLHLSYFQPRYHVKILTVTYINNAFLKIRTTLIMKFKWKKKDCIKING